MTELEWAKQYLEKEYNKARKRFSKEPLYIALKEVLEHIDDYWKERKE